jgi:cellulose synthase/poly-beta-1,6-N-acetylglucosamine synthase-like glycosyltransferase
MAANTNTSTQQAPGATDGTRRRRGSEFDNTTTRRASHGPRRLRQRFSAGARKSTSTELVPYNPSPRATAAPRTSLRNQLAQLYQNATQSMHRMHNRPPKVKTAKVVVVVPAHNEEESIARTIKALLSQTRQPDRIVVVADNCTDRTVQIASGFGRRVTVIETVGNRDRKVGALRTAWQQYVAYGYDYMLGVDADTVLSANSLEDLERELEMSPKVGGVMARYTFDLDLGSSRWARLLIRLQRMEFAAWTLDMLHRKRSTYVLGGQATLFRVSALQEVVDSERRLSPWDPEAQVEDMELTWALKARRWETKVSSTARAYAGAMVTVKSLWAQRRKWDEGMIRLLLGSKIGAATIYPWRMQAKMLINSLTRVLFIVLLTASLAIGAFKWNWIWVTPPVLAILLNLRNARKVPGHTPLDMFMAGTLVAVEFYLYFRLLVWAVSWGTVVAGIRRDGWARQYKAEGLPAGQTMIASGEVN